VGGPHNLPHCLLMPVPCDPRTPDQFPFFSFIPVDRNKLPSKSPQLVSVLASSFDFLVLSVFTFSPPFFSPLASSGTALPRHTPFFPPPAQKNAQLIDCADLFPWSLLFLRPIFPYACPIIREVPLFLTYCLRNEPSSLSLNSLPFFFAVLEDSNEFSSPPLLPNMI